MEAVDAGNPQAQAFSGIRVFDATQGVAGPHASMLLALHGADVVKVEPLAGDWGRTIGQTYGDHSAHSIAFNRAKRSIALDLKSDAGRGVAHRLAARADVVVESFRPGVMARLGLGYETLRGTRPDLVYCSVSGYGQHGPNRDRKVSDTIMQAFSGLMTVNRDDAGRPRRIGMIAIDVMTGLYAFQAISTAMLARLRFGHGAYIDCSMMQSVVAFQAAKILEHVLEGGDAKPLFAPIGTMPTKDGFINVSAVKQEHYVAICNALERPDLITDPRFADLDERISRSAELLEIVHAEFRKRPTAEWAGILGEAGVMNAPVAGYDELLADPHVAAVGALPTVEHDGTGAVPMANIPGLPPIEPGQASAHAPHVGEHTRAILAEAGYGADAIERLEHAGTVRQATAAGGYRGLTPAAATNSPGIA